MKAVLALLGLLLLLAAGWLLFTGGEPESEPLAAETAEAASPEDGELELGAAGLLRVNAGVESDREANDSARQSPSTCRFHGQLRIVSGVLPTPPLMKARIGIATPDLNPEEQSVVIQPRDLTFELSSADPDASCQVRFAGVIVPVRIAGGTLLEDGWIRFDSANVDMTVEAEVKPHIGVFFLRDPEGAPLAGGSAWCVVEAVGSMSTQRGAILDEDGLLIFEMERLSEVAGVDKVTFGVSRPPDVGSSVTAGFSIQDFLAFPRPVVLRFPATAELHFLVLDPARKPVAGAILKLGEDFESPPSGPDGRIEALQASPPLEKVAVEAAGFVKVTAAISLAAQQIVQEIELRPASCIRIVGEEAAASGWEDYRAFIEIDGSTDGSALLPDQFTGGRFREYSGSTGYNSNSDPSRMHYELETGFSKSGLVVLDGIYADVPAHVRVSWLNHQLVDERVPLRPGDGEHVVRVGPLPPRVRLSGTVLDPSGAPLAGAQVRLGGSTWSEIATSRMDGAFLLKEAAVGSSVRIRVTAAGLAPTEVEHLVAANDDDSIGAIIMSYGRVLQVLVLGPDGSPFVPQAGSIAADFRPTLQVYDEWIEPVKNVAATIRSGSWRFENLPGGSFICRLRFRWNIAGEPRSVDPAGGNATITLTQQEFDMLNTLP